MGDDRKPQREHRAAVGRVLDLDRASVLVGDLADDREPEAAALAPAGARAAVEAVEHVREVLGLDAAAVVAHPHATGPGGDLDDPR
jgi:hypothetical protein